MKLRNWGLAIPICCRRRSATPVRTASAQLDAHWHDDRELTGTITACIQRSVNDSIPESVGAVAATSGSTPAGDQLRSSSSNAACTFMKPFARLLRVSSPEACPQKKADTVHLWALHNSRETVGGYCRDTNLPLALLQTAFNRPTAVMSAGL